MQHNLEKSQAIATKIIVRVKISDEETLFIVIESNVSTFIYDVIEFILQLFVSATNVIIL